MYEFVEHWDLGFDQLMTRERYINTRGEFDPDRKFMFSRGIPGYNEGDADYRMGIDLLVSEYKATVAYARFLELAGDDHEALLFHERAAELSNLFHVTWWDESNQKFYSYLNKDNQLAHPYSEQKMAISLHDVEPWPLYWRAIQDTTKLRLTMKKMVESLPDKPDRSIEIQSHLPEILFHYNEYEAAYKQLQYLYQNDRREYPEASFSTIGAIVNGLMGVELEIHPLAEAKTNWSYVDRIITTLSGLTPKTSWAAMDHISIRKNDISVRHEGIAKTTVSNNRGPSILWKAKFRGRHENLLLNGKAVTATTENLISSEEKISWINVTIGAGEEMTVTVAE